MTAWFRVAEPERTNGRRAPGETKSEAGVRVVGLPAFLHKEVKRHLAWYAEKGAPFRRTSFGRKWRRARPAVDLPDGFRSTTFRTQGTPGSC